MVIPAPARRIACHAALAVLLAGCNSTAPWGRPQVSPGVRTITTLGDTPETVVAGTPGAARGSGPLLTGQTSRSDSRISGRVVDARGKPVAHAEVRLADGIALAGRERRAITDRAGGFTLTGLRPGTTYTLIAQAENGRLLQGRQRVEAPQSLVEIEVAPPEPVMTASRRAPEIDADWENPDRDNPRDRNPRQPASRRASQSSSGLYDDLEPNPMRDGSRVDSESQPTWRSTASESAGARPALVETPVLGPGRSIMGLPIEHDDDDRNPLPPAREPGRPSAPTRHGNDRADPGEGPAFDLPHTSPNQSATSAIDEPFTAGSGPLVPAFTDTSPAAGNQAGALPAEVGPERTDSDFPSFPSTAPSVPPSLAPPDQSAVSASNDQAGTLDTTFVAPPSSSPYPQEPAQPAPEPESLAPPAASDSGASSKPEVPAHPVETPREYDPPHIPLESFEETASALSAPSQSTTEVRSDPRSPTPPPSVLPRATWSELTSTSQTQRATIYPRSVRRLSRDPLPMRIGSRNSSGAADRELDRTVVRATCQFDTRQKRLLDFTLADTQGNPVQFRDIDADFILLDFWGTWCEPCVKSIPRLVALQNQYDPQRVRVVGIAYEQGTPQEKVANVNQMAEKLGVNYPVLIGEQDGQPCPLLAALKVSSYPTMILLDRNGRILWRDSGAGDKTLDRLASVIASNTRPRADILRR